MSDFLFSVLALIAAIALIVFVPGLRSRFARQMRSMKGKATPFVRFVLAVWDLSVFRPVARSLGLVLLTRFAKPVGDTRTGAERSDLPLVACVQRNGAVLIPAFLSHYRALGFEEFVFLDNMSTDGSVELLLSEPGVRVFQTPLSYRFFKYAMFEFLPRKFGRERWTLLADIDEFFDYPGSEDMPISGLVAYLDEEGCDAALTYMIDLYPETLPARDEGRNWIAEDVYFEATSMAEVEERYLSGANAIPAPHKVLNGGVRARVFGSYDLVTKSMLYRPARVKKLISGHFVKADLLCDTSFHFKHYKFLPPVYDRISEVILRKSHFRNSISYRALISRLDKETDLELFRDGISVEYTSSWSVSDAGIGRVSQPYREHVARFARQKLQGS